MPFVYIDADACPVKGETCRVAARHGVGVRVVANTFMAVPRARNWCGWGTALTRRMTGSRETRAPATWW
jgi:uncharacterized protein YaiI (UPF0178 family)